MNLEILKLKYPEIDYLVNVTVQDDSDGQGPYIKEWNLPYPVPTAEDFTQWEKDLAEELLIQQNKAANAALIEQLRELDLKSIRPLREGNLEKLQELDQQASEIRSQLLYVAPVEVTIGSSLEDVIAEQVGDEVAQAPVVEEPAVEPEPIVRVEEPKAPIE